MKKILLTLVAVFSFTIVFGQNENKYSPSTMQFISERDGEIELPKINQRVPLSFSIASPISMWGDPMLKKFTTRKIASAEMYNGEMKISAFIGLENNDQSGLSSLGVDVQAEFNNLVVAMIPVDKIEDVASLRNVTKIEVAEVLEVATDRQRTYTKAFDAITNSAAAQSLGITSPYTGAGVILGIIDTGIDFQHKAFKDKNGNTRIKRAYKLQSANSTSLTTYSTVSQINGLTYDTNTEDHGTHTSSTAGGSSVIVNGNNVTVTDDHANATYGGMAPEADLVIAGLSSLYTTAIGTAIQNICNYADQQGKPCVISLSLGSQNGPHDGSGSVSSIINQYAGNNHIIVYAASNDAMRADYFVQAGTSNGGGMYASGVSTNSKTILVNIQRSWTNADGNLQLYSPTIYACARSANVSTSLKFRVVDTTTGNVVYSTSAYSASTTISMTGSTGLAQYFKSQSGYYNQYGDNATIRLIRGTTNNKYYWTIYAPLLMSTSYDDADGDGIYNSKYALCVSIYPTQGSTIIDLWESGQICWFGNDLTLSSTYANSYNVLKGNDECSISDDACCAGVISVGAYVTRNSVTNYNNVTTDWSAEYPNIGDHASFSSWQTEGYGPLGTPLPTISAPGARIIAGINHYHTASVDDYSYWSDDFIKDLIVNNSEYAYGAMEGTSMATPCVSGIVAQWLQACLDAGKTPTPNYIKEVMAATWDTDEWTNGTGAGAHGANTFGTHGKINAIKGIQYILGVTAGPSIIASPSTLSMEAIYGSSTTATVNLLGKTLEGDVTATISGGNGTFSVDKTTITKSTAESGTTITVTFTPNASGTFNGTLTLSSSNAEPVTIQLTGTGLKPEIIGEPENLSFTSRIGQTTSQNLDVLAENLLNDVTLTLNDANNVFSLSQSSITKSDAEEGKTIAVSFTPSAAGDYSATLTLSSTNADPVTVQLNGTSGQPILSADEQLTITTGAGQTETGSFSVSGENLSGDVTLTLNDANGVFSLNESTISLSSAEEGADVTVSFSPQEAGEYTATVTVSSPYAESKTVTLNGTATKGWFDLTVGKYGVATLYTDIPLEIPYEAYDYDILGVYYGKEVVDGELKLRRVQNYIPANTAVIVMANSGSYRFPRTNVSLNPIENNILQGVLEATPVSELGGSVMTLGMGSNGYIGFYTYSGTTIRANSVYIPNDNNGVKTYNSLSIFTGENTTGINDIFGELKSEDSGSWFNLQGMKLNAKPTAPGIYIHNGKTVLVK